LCLPRHIGRQQIYGSEGAILLRVRDDAESIQRDRGNLIGSVPLPRATARMATDTEPSSEGGPRSSADGERPAAQEATLHVTTPPVDPARTC